MRLNAVLGLRRRLPVANQLCDVVLRWFECKQRRVLEFVFLRKWRRILSTPVFLQRLLQHLQHTRVLVSRRSRDGRRVRWRVQPVRHHRRRCRPHSLVHKMQRFSKHAQRRFGELRRERVRRWNVRYAAKLHELYRFGVLSRCHFNFFVCSKRANCQRRLRVLCRILQRRRVLSSTQLR